MYKRQEYLIRTYDLPLTLRDYEPAMRQVIRDLYKKVELKPGVREMLARLKAEGVRMCICSNTWAEQCEEVLTRLGVADCFEFFYTAQGAKSKAHPEVFHEVLERLGGSEPADAVVCGGRCPGCTPRYEISFRSPLSGLPPALAFSARREYHCYKKQKEKLLWKCLSSASSSLCTMPRAT